MGAVPRDQAVLAALKWGNMITDPGKTVSLDVTEPASVADAAHWVGERYGKLDVLVNNAAITYDTWQRAIDADLAVIREAAETNLYGPWLMVQ